MKHLAFIFNASAFLRASYIQSYDQKELSVFKQKRETFRPYHSIFLAINDMLLLQSGANGYYLPFWRTWLAWRENIHLHLVWSLFKQLLCSQACNLCADPLWEANEISEISKGNWVTVDVGAKIIKRDVTKAVARSCLVLEHNQGMNPPHRTEGETVQSYGGRWGDLCW